MHHPIERSLELWVDGSIDRRILMHSRTFKKCHCCDSNRVAYRENRNRTEYCRELVDKLHAKCLVMTGAVPIYQVGKIPGLTTLQAGDGQVGDGGRRQGRNRTENKM
eukprot:gnl/MRDRNA2_/MRDRNA2_83727_c0_seq6.p1 gnl/MRDRNA2_/MRDRNA2_83727_c0~~gnl/MRDRNA2_/MRDRNA2_83727_c0_seq6.p1  ORF type:complete len:107 (-),score=6.07 gnl/MRDRNA2_/MRDRNA2_83727_c0_seq6:45-365(-)